MAKANGEGVRSLKQIISQTKSSNSKAEGKGITGVTVGLEAQHEMLRMSYATKNLTS